MYVLVGIGLGIVAVFAWRTLMLARLESCRREVPTGGERYFASPCQELRSWLLLSLAGVSLSTLQSHLGKPDFCFDAYDVHGRPHQNETCLQPGWSFFYMPPHDLGGGPNLVCSSGGGKTCRWLYWLGTA